MRFSKSFVDISLSKLSRYTVTSVLGMIRGLGGAHGQVDVEVRTNSKNSRSAFKWSYAKGYQGRHRVARQRRLQRTQENWSFLCTRIFAKFVVIKKPATKQRTGINPFTKEPAVFKAKPARKVIRARPVKAVKDAVA